MSVRWRILMLLFAVRAVMAIQFQTVGALSPVFGAAYGVSLADIGLLIGLYSAPGLLIAWPGGALGRRFGDARMVIGGLLLMAAGGALPALVPSWEVQIAGRLIAGAGGILLNVLMAKMVADWFVGREIATAMAVFVTSWPAGVAFALLALPVLVTGAGLDGLALGIAGLALLGAAGLAAWYRPPEEAAGAAGRAPEGDETAPRLSGRPLAGVFSAGLVWALYNVAIGMVFGFGPAMLTARGWSVEGAGAATSAALWALAATAPLGGVLADRTGRRDLVIATGLLCFGALLPLAARVDGGPLLFVALGLFAGLSAGPIMALPAAALPPALRAPGMGLFYTIYYALFSAAPPVAGWLSDLVGDTGVAFDFGAASLLAAVAALAAYRISQSAPVRTLPPRLSGQR